MLRDAHGRPWYCNVVGYRCRPSVLLADPTERFPANRKAFFKRIQQVRIEAAAHADVTCPQNEACQAQDSELVGNTGSQLLHPCAELSVTKFLFFALGRESLPTIFYMCVSGIPDFVHPTDKRS